MEVEKELIQEIDRKMVVKEWKKSAIDANKSSKESELLLIRRRNKKNKEIPTCQSSSNNHNHISNTITKGHLQEKEI